MLLLLMIISLCLISLKANVAGELDFRPAENPDHGLPKVLLIGDSVCKGYHKKATDLLKGKANVDVWITGANLGSTNLSKEQREIIGHGPYEVIHFNIGLHGLGDRIPEDEYETLLHKYVNLFHNYSIRSELIWASTTPVRVKGSSRPDNEPGRNPLIVQRNVIAARKMSKAGVGINDLYSLVVDKPGIMIDDGVHWTEEGYDLMAEQVVSHIAEVLFPPDVQVEPTLKNVPYGPFERNTLNFWKADSEKPTPVVMLIHGGGWGAGRKAELVPFGEYLSKGISVVSINYRLIKTDILPAPVYDAARALQFVRSKAKEWNICKKRIAVTGGSAGGCTSLWLIYHDDLADPDSDDPVLRESTKPLCAAVESAQSCLDPFVTREWIGDHIVEHSMLWKAVGAKSPEDLLENYGEFRELSHDFSPWFHVDKDDPPVFMVNHNVLTVPAADGGLAIHHPMFLIKMKEKADKVGAEVQLILRSPRRHNYYEAQEFLVSNLLGK